MLLTTPTAVNYIVVVNFLGFKRILLSKMGKKNVCTFFIKGWDGGVGGAGGSTNRFLGKYLIHIHIYCSVYCVLLIIAFWQTLFFSPNCMKNINKNLQSN